LVTLQSSLFITRSDNRGTWEAVVAHEDELRERLAEMFMQLMVDHEMGVAFKTQDPDENAPGCSGGSANSRGMRRCC
jgi:hypothetical protein